MSYETYNSSVYGFIVHKLGIEDIYHNTIMESRNATLFKDIFPLKKAQENNLLKRMIEVSSINYHHSEDYEV